LPEKPDKGVVTSPQAEVQDCERCEGKGVVYEPGTLQTHPPIVGSNVPCPRCNGTGKQSPAEPRASKAFRDSVIRNASEQVAADRTGFLTPLNRSGVSDCDDICTCGHERFAHAVNETEEGPCRERGCPCSGFSAEPQGDVQRAAEWAVKGVPPTCNVCGVEYVEGFEGPCQEPLPPYTDPSRTCPGRVAVHPEKIAETVITAITPLLYDSSYVRERLSKESYRLKREARAERHASANKDGDQGNDWAARAYEDAADSLDAILAALAKEDSR